MMLSTGNQVNRSNSRVVNQAQRTVLPTTATSSQVFVVSTPSLLQPNTVASSAALELDEISPQIGCTENWVLGSLDNFAAAPVSSEAGTLRRYPELKSRTLNGYHNGLVQQEPRDELILLYTPPQPLDVPPTIVLQGAQNIDMAISNFHIKFDGKERFKPGDELSGKVIMDVWSHIHIKFVEFIIQGKGTVRVFKDSSTFLEKPRNEIYLDKKIVLLGPKDGSLQGMTLTPGRYVSSFSYQLPENLPPTVHQFDMGHGYVFDISYDVKAHVCDKIRSKHLQGQAGGNSSKIVRVIKATKKRFSMTASKDWQTIPGATEPIVHAEQLQLFMSRSSKEPTSVLYNLNKAVYPLGDSIKLNIEVFHPKKRKVKNVQAELEQQIEFSKDAIRKFRRVLIRALDNQTMRHTTDHENMVRSQFSIPVPPNLVPSYLPHCRMLDVTYTMKVIIRFQHFGGELIVKLPIVIAPASDEGNNQDNPDLPVFNKPIMQFPYFSKSPIIPDANGSGSLDRRSLDRRSNTESGHGSMRSNVTTRSNGTTRAYGHSNGALQSNHGNHAPSGARKRAHRKKRDFQKNDKVTTKYKPGINCCSCWASCMGYGIYETT